MTTTPPGAAKRPTLLTVICILSFIGGAIGLWGGYANAFTDFPQKQVEESKNQLQEMTDQVGADSPMIGLLEDGLAMNEKNLENAKPIGYSNLVLSLIGITGVWLMWNLRKTGFWIYLVASVGGLTSAFYFLGGEGLFANITTILTTIITVIFIILFGVNVKHMR